MNYVALYRKYRPETFDDVIGQDHIVATLKNQIKNGKVSHAYLFCGTRGTGKTSTAKIFARAINCTDNKDGSPCLRCKTCMTLKDNGMDIIEMDAASNNGVDYARDIREKVQYPPVSCRYKVYIIDEVHMLSQGAFNALLKTLEEPPEHAVFILCTTEVHKIPATILSRCMRFDFRLVSAIELAAHIAEVYDKEGKKYTQEAVHAIAAAAEGSVRDSLSIADRCISLSDDKLKYDDVMNVLGVSSFESTAALGEAMLKCDAGEILKRAVLLTDEGKDVGRLTKDLTRFFRNVLIVKTCREPKKLLLLPENVYKTVEDCASYATEDKLLYAVDCLAKLERDLRYSLSPLMQFEAAALRIASGIGDTDVAALEKRVARLEQLPSNITENSFIIVDKNDALSIWKGVKSELKKLSKPLLSAVWDEVEVECGGAEFRVVCNNAQYNLIVDLEYFEDLSRIINKICGKTLKAVKKSEPEKIADTDEQLAMLGDNVKFKEQ